MKSVIKLPFSDCVSIKTLADINHTAVFDRKYSVFSIQNKGDGLFFQTYWILNTEYLQGHGITRLEHKSCQKKQTYLKELYKFLK